MATYDEPQLKELICAIIHVSSIFVLKDNWRLMDDALCFVMELEPAILAEAVEWLFQFRFQVLPLRERPEHKVLISVLQMELPLLRPPVDAPASAAASRHDGLLSVAALMESVCVAASSDVEAISWSQAVAIDTAQTKGTKTTKATKATKATKTTTLISTAATVAQALG